MASLAARLEIARRSRFVGRKLECEQFAAALQAAELPFYLFLLYGPGGVGKTTLLRELTTLARAAQQTTVHLDARHMDPSPPFFIASLQNALGLAAGQAPQAYLGGQNTRYVIFIDTSELLTPLDSWLRDEFFPQMPANVLTVLAGRNPPAMEWRTDPGWQSLVKFWELRNLAPDESSTFLHQCAIPSRHHPQILAFTHGHPLALSLMADVFGQKGDMSFRPEEAPDLIAALVERLIQHVPSPAHRAALEACAMVRVMTEGLLAAMLAQPDVHTIFGWLRTLSFIDHDRGGLYPHDLAREALAADLRWRNPTRYTELHARARGYYMHYFPESDSRAQRAILQDTLYLHRDNPLVRPYFEWQETGAIYSDRPRADEHAEIMAMVAHHQGPTAAQIAAHWLTEQPQLTTVFRNAKGKAQGVLIMVALEKVTGADRQIDPAIDLAVRFLAGNDGMRADECATYFRFWLAYESYQAVSPVQSSIFLTMVQHYLVTSGLSFTLLPCAAPAFWTMVFAYADLVRLPALDFTTDGRRYGLYGHNWRTVPPLPWLNLLAEREVARGAVRLPPPVTETVIALSEVDFAEAVRAALRDLHNPTALRTNGLLKSRLLWSAAAADNTAEARLARLPELLRKTAALLQQTPRQNKLYRALHHTYFQPAATQEAAAELLDLPFSTYRRHLRSGIDFLCETLWQQELGGG